MRFLIDADLPRGIPELLAQDGHLGIDVRDIGLGRAEDVDIAAHAKSSGFGVMTGDFGFADIRNYPPDEYQGIVVLEVPEDATASFILHMIEMFRARKDVLARLPGRLAIVSPWRVRLRPA